MGDDGIGHGRGATRGGTRGATRGATRRRGWVSRAVLLAIALILADQLVLYLLLGDGELFGRRIAPYDPPLFAPSQRELVERLRTLVERGETAGELGGFTIPHDPELGWCNRPESGDGRFDWAGARVGRGPLPREKRAGVRRIVLVGCSFSYGEEVGDRETWPARLEAARADLEIVNLGVSAYGSDQAWLRYRRDGARLEPDEVWLGFTPITLPRLTTIYRPARIHWTNLAWFKPRFLIDRAADATAGGDAGIAGDTAAAGTGAVGLRLLPNPGSSLARTLELLTDQRAFVDALGAHDRWIRAWPAAYAPEGSRAVHYTAVGRLMLTLLEVSRGEPEAELDDADSEATRLLAAIVPRFAREVTQAGARFRLVVLPSRRDLRYWRDRGSAPSRTAVFESFRQAGVEVIDLTQELLDRGLDHDDAQWMPGSHYSPAANRAVAGLLAAR